MKSKRKTRTKVLSWLLSLALMFSLVPSFGMTTWAQTYSGMVYVNQLAPDDIIEPATLVQGVGSDFNVYIDDVLAQSGSGWFNQDGTYKVSSISESGGQYSLYLVDPVTVTFITDVPASEFSTANGDIAIDKATYSNTGVSANGVDGTFDTRWESAQADDEWFMLDLGDDPVEYNTVGFAWETAYAAKYEIRTSSDGDTFTTAATVEATSPQSIQINLGKTYTDRYIWVQIIERGTNWGNSFYEMGVWNKTASTDETTEKVISWSEDAQAGNLADTYGSENFLLTRTDSSNKHSIDPHNAAFGTAENYKVFTHRLKTGGKSSSSNSLKLTVGEAGTLNVYARTASSSATDRTLVLKQGGTELYNKIVQESDAVDVEGLPSPLTKVYPVISVEVQAGDIEITYPENALYFYGFSLTKTETPSSDSIFEWTKGDGTTIENDNTNLNGNNMGTMTVGKSVVARILGFDAIENNAKGYKLGHNNVCIEIEGTRDFEAGDTVVITGVCGGSGDRAFAVAPVTAENSNADDIALTNTQNSQSETLEYKVVLEDAQAGSKLRIFRQSGKVMYIDSIKVLPKEDKTTAYGAYVPGETDDETALAGKVVQFNGYDWYLIEDNSTSETEGTVTLLSKECVGASIFGGSSTYSGSTVEGFVNNYYTNSISTDAKTVVSGNGMFLLTTDQANAIKTANVDVLKCSKATGAESILWWLGSPCDPYNAACVYGDDGSIRDSGEHVERTLGVRPALKLDLSKVEFNSETKTFALPQPLVEYPLWLGGVQVTNKNASNIDGNNKASYDAETNTLTLNGYTNSGTARADIQSGVNNAAIYYDDNMFSPNPLTIQLAEGTTNSLTMTGDRVYGIYVFGSALTITGNGTLNVQSEEMAINDAWGVAITGGTVYAASSGYYGINSVTIGSDISAVTVTGKLGAVYGGSNEEQALKNAVAGTGWTDEAGTTGKADLAISTTGQNVSSYKKVYFTTHTHDFTYSVSGATITATCSANGCPLPPSSEGGTDHVATLTIVAPTLTTYGGTGDAVATLTGLTDFNTLTGLNVQPSSIVYWNAKIQEGVYKTDGDQPLTAAPTSVGNYLAKITVNNCIASVGYTIAKVAPVAGNFTYAAPSDLTYDGTAKTATVAAKEGITGVGQVTVKYYSDAACTTEVDNPTDVGTYYVGITVTEGDNYNAVTSVIHGASWTFTITKANPTADAPTDLTATYGQTLANVSLEGKNPEGNTPGTWAWADAATTSVGSVGVRTFKANFTPTDTTNYNSKSNVDVTVTVGKATPTYTVPTGLTATYGDLLSSVALPTGWAWTNGAQSVGNAGSNTFTATFTPTDTDNYNTVENVNVTVTVNKADPTYTVPTGLTATYGDTIANVTLPTGWAWADSTQSVGNAGTKTFKANFTPTDTTNYNTVSNVDVSVTVNKADPSYTVPTGLTATYGDTIANVTLPTGWAWADSTQSVGNAGTKTFKANFTPTDTANYNTVENVDVTLTVNPASVTLTANSGNEIYDATEKTVEGFTASVEGLTFTGVTAGVSGTNAGEYAVTFTGVTVGETKDSTGNYVVTETTDGKLTIGKAPLAVTADNLSKRTGDTDPALTYKAEGFVGTDTAETVITGTLVRDEGDDVGTYPIKQGTLAANDNYEITFTEGTFTINRRSSGGGGGTTTYTVKFDTTGGSDVKNVSVKSGQTIGSIQEPQKKGFIFTGWYSNEELSDPYSADEKVTENTTLYAGWKVDPVREFILTIGEEEATVWNEARSNDVAPIIRNDRTMLPARFVTENLGATVEWIGEEQKVLITKDDMKIEIYIGSDKAYVNGEEVTLDSPAFIENDRTYTPVRFIAETLGVTVDWDEATQQVIITKPVE